MSVTPYSPDSPRQSSIIAALVALFICLILLSCLGGCARAEVQASERPRIVCTVFPQYDWVRQILGDQADAFELTLLTNDATDLHNYQPSVADVVKISSCDLFIYVGGESDGWVGDLLKNTTNKNMAVINLLGLLGDAAKLEETLEGMETFGESYSEEDYDEHVWLSLNNTRLFCPAIAAALSDLDPGNAGEYRNNLAAYLEKLAALDAAYQESADSASEKTLLFGDRFPFRYLMEDYGLTPYAAFTGCSAETEASFDTIIYLAQKADELQLKNIIVTESADQSIAKTIIDNTKEKNQKILVLDAMQSVTQDDVQNGTTYFSIMENNLNVLKEAMN